MGYYFSTKSKSGHIYTITKTDDPTKLMISGGQFSNHEIHKPNGMIGEGIGFPIHLTNNPCNGGLAGQKTWTSPVTSIHYFDESHTNETRLTQTQNDIKTSVPVSKPDAYTITTGKNNHVYTITNTDDPNVQLISGGQFYNHEMYASHLEINQPLQSMFTNNPSNGSLANAPFHTSVINTITPVFHEKQKNMPEKNNFVNYGSHDQYIEHAGQFTIVSPSDLHTAKCLQKAVHDIEDGVTYEMGLPESNDHRQKIFISNDITNSNGLSTCVVAFTPEFCTLFQDRHLSTHMIAEHLKSYLTNYLPSQCDISTDPAHPIRGYDLVEMQKKYSDENLKHESHTTPQTTYDTDTPLAWVNINSPSHDSGYEF